MPTTEEWRAALDEELASRQPTVSLYSNYYDGNHRLSFATSKFREAFGDLFEAFATNWCGLVVDVAVERLAILGFRFGEDDADDEAWRIWQANGLDSKSIAGHTEAVKCMTSYLAVGPPREPGGEPVITVEHPSQVIVAHDPSDRRIRLAALKKYRTTNGDMYAVVYEPKKITTFVRRSFAKTVEVLGVWLPEGALGGADGSDWEIASQEDNPLGIVPIVPLENSPNLLTGGTSDLKPAIALNDAANKFFTDMIHASEFTSFPQRVLTGVELPRDPVTREILPAEEIRAAVSRIWAFEDPAAKVYQLAAGDLSSYVEGVDLAVQHLAAQTRTPPHYLLAKLANLSGDALKAAETGLVARCKRKHVDFSDSWEEAMRLAFRWRAIDREGWVGADEDLARAEMTDAETIWSDPESKDAITVAQALVNEKTFGVPDEILWEKAGYTPQQIKRMKVLRDEQQQREMELMAAGGGQPVQPGQEQGGPKTPSVGVSVEGGKLVVSGLPGPSTAPEPAHA